MQLTKLPREFDSVRRIFVEGFMFFLYEKFTCSSLYNIIDKQQDCLFDLTIIWSYVLVLHAA